MSSMIGMSEPVEIFCSYADSDESLCNELEMHLSLLCKQGLITTWHKRRIAAGTDTSEAVDEHLNKASVILLLVSSDFVASDYCYGTEMSRAVARHEAGEARVIPILLRPVDNWRSAPFGKHRALPSNEKPVISWSLPDEAFADIVSGIRAELQSKIVIIPPSSPLSPPWPALWNVPYPRNPFFTGREDLLARLHAQLQADHATALSQPLGISGLGGIGKTQIAIEYAYRHARDYQAVLWTRAESQEELVAGYVATAGLLNLPEKDAKDQRLTIEAVKAWLQSHRQWLLILDNADGLAWLSAFLPTVMSGHLLLTTRAQAMGQLASRIEVKTFSVEQGALFLLRRGGLLESKASLEQASIEDRELAMLMTEELGGLPLALDQAGAYLDETQCSLADYQRLYQTQRRRMHGVVATTWSLSFEKVEAEMSGAANLLRLCAFLSADAIPEEIITRGATFLGSMSGKGERKKRWSWFSLPFLREEADNRLQDIPAFDLNEAVAVLGAYSLLRRERKEERSLSVHRLVQEVVQDALPPEERKQWMLRAVLAVNSSFPDVTDWVHWAACERWFPHGLVCATWIEQEQMHFVEAARLLNRMGYYLDGRGRYREALPLYERALEIYEEKLGMEHPETAESLTNLAELYQMLGKYEEALALYERALKTSEEKLGVGHPSTATSLNNLAVFYERQGKYGEALVLCKRVLKICERQLGADHPQTQIIRENYAILLHKLKMDNDRS